MPGQCRISTRGSPVYHTLSRNRGSYPPLVVEVARLERFCHGRRRTRPAGDLLRVREVFAGDGAVRGLHLLGPSESTARERAMSVKEMVAIQRLRLHYYLGDVLFNHYKNL